MKLTPIGSRVIIKRLPKETQTASGIFLPDVATEKPDQGEVIAVGAGATLHDGSIRPMYVKTGDRVLFGKYAGNTIKLEGEEFVVMQEDDLIAVVEKE